MRSPDKWETTGLYDPSSPSSHERLALLAFLEEQGFSVAEMQHADAEGRLFALAGDRVLRGGAVTLSLADVAEKLAADVDLVTMVWDGLGFERATSDSLVATDSDVRAVSAALVLVDLLGVESALALFRAYGSAMARVSDAESAAFRPVSAVSVRRSGSELTTAKTWLDLTTFVGEVGHLLDVTHRQRIDASRRFFEAAGTETILSDSDREVRLGVAFIDLSGYTALSQILPAEDLARLLDAFERTTHEAATRHRCQVVKFIGDAAMIVSPDLTPLARLASEVVASFTEPTAARAGLAHGNVVAREGDYFGGAVNLAARLIAAAPPTSVTTTPAVVEQLSAEWQSRSLGTREFRGFGEPIAVVEISPAHV